MPVALILAARGSDAAEWTRGTAGLFRCVVATTWRELAVTCSVEAGVEAFHLAERLGLRSAEGHSVVHDRGTDCQPRFLVTTPQLPAAVVRDTPAAISRAVTEALVAVAAHNEAAAPGDTIATLGWLASRIAGADSLSIRQRAHAIGEGITTAAALLK